MKNYVLFMILSMTLLLTACSKKNVDLMEYASVSFHGLDEKGTAKLDIDWSAFENAVLSEEEKNDIKGFSKLIALEESIHYSLDKTESLSNGDEITVSVVWNKDLAKEYKLNLSGNDKKLIVEDLAEPIVIDLFADLTIEFEGISPQLKATIRNTTSDPFIKTVSYSIDQDRNLKNGDQVTVTATYREDQAEEQGYAINETEKVFIIENADEYITSYDQISKELLSKLEIQATDLVEAKLANRYGSRQYYYPNSYEWRFSFDSIEISDISLINGYFLKFKEGMDKSYDDVNNCLFLVYQVNFVSNLTAEDEAEDVTYISVYFKDFILRDTGNIDVVISDGRLSSYNNIYDDLYRDIVTVRKAKYSYEEIDYTGR